MGGKPCPERRDEKCNTPPVTGTVKELAPILCGLRPKKTTYKSLAMDGRCKMNGWLGMYIIEKQIRQKPPFQGINFVYLHLLHYTTNHIDDAAEIKLARVSSRRSAQQSYRRLQSRATTWKEPHVSEARGASSLSGDLQIPLALVSGAFLTRTRTLTFGLGAPAHHGWVGFHVNLRKYCFGRIPGA
ncbi:hypothetical protein BS47DRAFT_248515 [Hydnum rufescens UP504]|uniref:Uncharacterized protein n=1 Tax=Hydnum rufescens UP504 TaxID=1448309 RepID=A0A9P6ALN6_9AGAM|nr:hypothetical protein BS47DRAFT_248515 [Hydnum rufescens UP504]